MPGSRQTRLRTALALDLRLQRRYGFLYAITFATLLWVVILVALPDFARSWAVPLVVFVDLAVVGFYFVAALVLYEKGEATVLALAVTPLRFGEYLTAKLVTLTLLALVSSMVVALVGVGFRLDLPLYVVGVISASLLTTLAGFITVSPFRSISSYLIPSSLVLTPIGLPIVDYIGWWQSPLLYAIPTQGSMLLLRGAFQPIEAWQVVYALAYQSLWVIILAVLARRAYDRYVVGRRGSG